MHEDVYWESFDFVHQFNAETFYVFSYGLLFQELGWFSKVPFLELHCSYKVLRDKPEIK